MILTGIVRNDVVLTAQIPLIHIAVPLGSSNVS